MLHHSSSQGPSWPMSPRIAPTRSRILQRLRLVFARPELVVDAPQVVGLAVDQHGAARVAGRIEEGASLGRKIVRHLHVGDDVSSLVVLAGEPQAQHRAERRTRPVRGEHVLRLEFVTAPGGLDAKRHEPPILPHGRGRGLPAHVDQRLTRDGVMQELLGVLLLQVVHRLVFFADGMRHFEPEDLRRAEVAAPMPPGQRLGEEGLDRADPLQDPHA
jgi:hypothetical protein